MSDDQLSENNPPYGVIQIDGESATSVKFERNTSEGKSVFDLSFYSGKKLLTKLKNLDDITLTAAVGKYNAKTMVEYEKDKGTLKQKSLLNAIGLSPEEVARQIQSIETQKSYLAKDIEQGDPGEKNIIEETSAIQLINSQEALERLDHYRQHEREELAQNLKNDHPPAPKTESTATNLDRKEIFYENATSEEHKKIAEIEKIERAKLIKQIHNQFRVIDGKYHFKDHSGQVAFKDKGSKLVTSSNDDHVVKAMTAMAKAKGWKTVKVSGHKEFRREVWFEASLNGLDVSGYHPTEQDLKNLSERIDRRMQNTIEKISITNEQKTNDPQAEKQKPTKETIEKSNQQESSLLAPNQPKKEQDINKKDEIKKTDKHKIIEAIAAAYIDANVKDQAQRSALKAAIEARLNEKSKTGTMPNIEIYDKQAPQKEPNLEQSQQAINKNTERIR